MYSFWARNILTDDNSAAPSVEFNGCNRASEAGEVTEGPQVKTKERTNRCQATGC